MKTIISTDQIKDKNWRYRVDQELNRLSNEKREVICIVAYNDTDNEYSWRSKGWCVDIRVKTPESYTSITIPKKP